MPAEISWTFKHYRSAPSTNTMAIELLRRQLRGGKGSAALLHGTVLLAEQQTGGRGQYGRVFASPPGGLYASAILHEPPVELRPLLALAAGVAVVNMLEAAGVPLVGLRWPNDVLLGRRKVCGILCEAVALGQECSVVIGIGMNVNTELAQLPPALHETATSLRHATGRQWSVLTIATAMFQGLGSVLCQGERAGPEWLLAEANRVDVLRGRTVTLEVDKQRIVGRACGISPRGCLVVQAGAQQMEIETGTVVDAGG